MPPLSECETISMAEQFSRDSVAVARSDPVFPTVSERFGIVICRTTSLSV